MEQNYLPRNIKIDWLRFQFESSSSQQIHTLQSMIQLPFEKKGQQMADVRDTNLLALNKIWHEIYEFQNSLIGVYYAPSSGTNVFHRYFVDLNGSTLDSMEIETIRTLLIYAEFQNNFIANRIDIALDFPLQSTRLSMRYWESFVKDGLLIGYRTVRRIMTRGGNREGTTVYLGSRESERSVRIYDKNINGVDFDRLEVELKRSRALWVMQQIANSPPDDLPSLLNGVVCGQINFVRWRSDIDFFKIYKYGPISVPAPQLHLDIERSIAFIRRHSATYAMLNEFMGSKKYDQFMQSVLETGKLKIKPRHRNIIANAKFLGVTCVGILLILTQTSNAIATNLTCPAPVSLGSQMVQKFPIDIVMPTAAEQAYFNNIGNGCFQVNSGLEFQSICLPGMIVNALKPFVIMGLGIKFIFND